MNTIFKKILIIINNIFKSGKNFETKIYTIGKDFKYKYLKRQVARHAGTYYRGRRGQNRTSDEKFFNFFNVGEHVVQNYGDLFFGPCTVVGLFFYGIIRKLGLSYKFGGISDYDVIMFFAKIYFFFGVLLIYYILDLYHYIPNSISWNYLSSKYTIEMFLNFIEDIRVNGIDGEHIYEIILAKINKIKDAIIEGGWNDWEKTKKQGLMVKNAFLGVGKGIKIFLKLIYHKICGCPLS